MTNPQYMSNPARLEQIRRRRAIYAMRAQGLTLRAVGLHFGINAERVRQIVLRVEREREKYGDVSPEWLLARQLAEEAEGAKQRKIWRDQEMAADKARKNRWRNLR